jgi:hypothetical protein
MWKLVSVRLEIVLILTYDRCTVCAERTIGLEIILDTPKELLGDMGHDKYRFGPLGDVVSVSARVVHGLCQTYHWLWTHPLILLGDEAQVEAHFCLFRDSANLDAK